MPVFADAEKSDVEVCPGAAELLLVCADAEVDIVSGAGKGVDALLRRRGLASSKWVEEGLTDEAKVTLIAIERDAALVDEK
jgi:hypothetical protein